MVDLQWEDPPAHALTSQRPGQYREFATALRDNPQRWAVLPGERASENSARSTLQNLRRGKMSNFPKGEFEAVIDKTKIFVRYVGEPEASPPSGGSAGPDSAIIRAWAVENGYDLPSRGRLSQDVIDAYMDAHPL